MALQASYKKKTFLFNFRARTSRGSMFDRESWFLLISEEKAPNCVGIGEAGPLPGLSVEWDNTYEQRLEAIISQFNEKRLEISTFPLHHVMQLGQTLCGLFPELFKNPSALFAFETALLDLHHGGNRFIFKNKFIEGTPIPINGLIWMGGLDMMLQQIEIKVQEGFNCIKLKVGGLDFEKECDILQYIRRKYFKMDIVVRLDANGAFKQEEAIDKLNQLAQFDIQSIEQPIEAGLSFMTELCKSSPIPIALDEELIGHFLRDEKRTLLGVIKPQYIVLKPSLHGSLSGCQEWIEEAEARGIGWWMTSALESSIGLNAIAQFTAEFDNPLAQGLGTGKIYENNFDAPLEVKSGELSYLRRQAWILTDFS